MYCNDTKTSNAIGRFVTSFNNKYGNSVELWSEAVLWGGLENDTIGGYNAMLSKQKKEVGEAVITTVLFDDQYELLHDRVSIKSVRTISEKEYFVRGTTALLDAIGRTIHKIGNAQKKHSRR